jgi:hypothetical protein
MSLHGVLEMGAGLLKRVDCLEENRRVVPLVRDLVCGISKSSTQFKFLFVQSIHTSLSLVVFCNRSKFN